MEEVTEICKTCKFPKSRYDCEFICKAPRVMFNIDSQEQPGMAKQYLSNTSEFDRSASISNIPPAMIQDWKPPLTLPPRKHSPPPNKVEFFGNCLICRAPINTKVNRGSPQEKLICAQGHTFYTKTKLSRKIS